MNANLTLPFLGDLSRDARDDAAVGRRPLKVDGTLRPRVVDVTTSKNKSTAACPGSTFSMT